MNTGYEVRQSKSYFIIGCVSAIIIIVFLLSVSLFLLVDAITAKNITLDNKIGLGISVGVGMSFTLAVMAMLIYIIYQYLYQKDIYMEHKLIRKVKEKVIFELEYSKIKGIKESYFSLFLFCEQPIIKANGKKGPKTIIEQYSNNDVRRIKQIISNSTSNLNFN